jgi:hypothetical protein
VRKKYPCPCCWYLTLEAEAPGTYELCPVCYWEDDPVAANNINEPSEINHLSLRQAQDNFKRFGFSHRRWKAEVRPPFPDER